MTCRGSLYKSRCLLIHQCVHYFLFTFLFAYQNVLNIEKLVALYLLLCCVQCTMYTVLCFVA